MNRVITVIGYDKTMVAKETITVKEKEGVDQFQVAEDNATSLEQGLGLYVEVEVSYQ